MIINICEFIAHTISCLVVNNYLSDLNFLSSITKQSFQVMGVGEEEEGEEEEKTKEEKELEEEEESTAAATGRFTDTYQFINLI